MGIASGLTVFFIIWWTVLFAVLPWGIQTDESTGQVGAPKIPGLRKKFIATTIVTSLIWLIIFLLVRDTNFLSFRHMANEMQL